MYHVNEILEVRTHEGISLACDLSPCPVPVTGPLRSYHQGTGRGDLSHKEFTRSVLRNKTQELVPKIQIESVGLVASTKVVPCD